MRHKFTSAPWRDESGHVYGADGFHVCDPRCESALGDNMAEMDANTALIVAAPDMARLLGHVWTRLEVEEASHPGGVYLCGAMRSEIRKTLEDAGALPEEVRIP